MNKKRIFFLIISAILIGSLAYGAYFLVSLSSYQKAAKSIEIEKVELSYLSDGTYYGSCDINFVSAQVSVEVKAHKIVNITLIKHKNDRGESAEVILERVIKAQSLEVDVVSGATNSSKVILEAIENALIQSE